MTQREKKITRNAKITNGLFWSGMVTALAASFFDINALVYISMIIAITWLFFIIKKMKQVKVDAQKQHNENEELRQVKLKEIRGDKKELQ